MPVDSFSSARQLIPACQRVNLRSCPRLLLRCRCLKSVFCKLHFHDLSQSTQSLPECGVKGYNETVLPGEITPSENWGMSTLKQGVNTYKRHRFSPEIISYAVWLYYRFNLSHRDIEDLLAERGIAVSHESIPKCPCRCLQSIQLWQALGIC